MSSDISPKEPQKAITLRKKSDRRNLLNEFDLTEDRIFQSLSTISSLISSISDSMEKWECLNSSSFNDTQEMDDDPVEEIEQDLEETLIGTTRGKRPTIHNEMSN
jgi:hypothetical protein